MVSTTAALLTSACAPGGLGLPAAPTPAELPTLEARLARDSSDVELTLRVAAGYRASGRRDEARKLLERAVVRTPDGAAVLLLGLSHEEAGDAAAAMRAYEAWVREAPRSELRDHLQKRLLLLQRQALRDAVRQALLRESELAGATPAGRSVAVFPFADLQNDPRLRPLGRALAEMLTTDLSLTGRLVVLERSRVQLVLDELALGTSGFADPAAAVRGGRLLGAERIVQGSLRGSDSELDMTAAITRVAAAPAAVRPSVQVSDALSRFIDMEKQLALDLHESLGIELTPAERQRISERPTENIQALIAFGLGLEAEDAGRFQEAAQHFDRARSIDRGFEEARARRDRARDLETVSVVTTSELEEIAVAELSAGADLLAAETVMPPGTVRDAVAETLGVEQVQQGRLLDIVIRRR